MRVLVTGGAGFVGSNVVDALAARGDEVTALDDLSTGDRQNLASARVELVVADISDRAALLDAVRGRRFDAVVHLASKTKVGQSVEQPDLYRRVIVDGTANVLEAARAAGVRRFVNFSSGGVIYGETATCADEGRPIAPVSPYGKFKAEAEELVAGSGIPALTLRPANIYGPRQRTDLEGGVVAQFHGCWRSGTPISIRGGGAMERDYMYVGDVSDAVVAGLGSERQGVYNIGTGVATSVARLVALMTDVLGPPPGVRQVPALPGELQRNCLDVSKAARDGLWHPRHSLAEGLRLTLA
ncbi:MAG TPA: NAD-dependent epimerase/dehydratase family protein [Candidatus Limnocylindria bacterium]|nr:NAD-dependent epimerase/dehydratase family protein [Candidatus Limnocylindria bacterium]